MGALLRSRSWGFAGLYSLTALLSGLFIGVFAGLLPARYATRKSIVEAVQYE